VARAAAEAAFEQPTPYGAEIRELRRLMRVLRQEQRRLLDRVK
jgi:hypothetical protein